MAVSIVEKVASFGQTDEFFMVFHKIRHFLIFCCKLDGMVKSLFADADNEKAVDNFNLRTEDQRVSDVQKEIVCDVLQGSATDFFGGLSGKR